MFEKQLSGAELRGIDPPLEEAVSGIGGVMQAGSLENCTPGDFNMVLGVELAEALQVGVGDKVTVTLAEGMVTPAGVVPRTKRFTVSGIYPCWNVRVRSASGVHQYPRRAETLSDAGRDHGCAACGDRNIRGACDCSRGRAGEWRTRSGSDWTRRHVNFFRSIQITKSILFVILMMVIAVAAFNIVSTLVMVVKDKQSDIAILRTIGARPIEHPQDIRHAGQHRRH